jgi:hypothetical protein
MADAHFIKVHIEPAMRTWLTAQLGVPFREREMPLRWGGQGEGNFKFDAVSEDGAIVACLSTARNLKAGQGHKLLRDATFMWLVPGVKTRILAVVEQSVATALNSELQRGRLPPATEIKIVELSTDHRERLETFRLSAADEVGGAGKRVPLR